MDNATKARENRLRRAAARQGFAVIKSPVRDPQAKGYGLWRAYLTDCFHVSAITAAATLEQMEAFFAGDDGTDKGHLFASMIDNQAHIERLLPGAKT